MELIIIFVTIFISIITCFLFKRRALIEFVSVAATLVTFIGSILIALKVAANGTYAPYKFLAVDSLGSIVVLIIGLIGFVSTIYSVRYLREETKKEIIGLSRVRQYFILLNLFILAMLFAITSSNPIFTWISIEATTLSTAFLISFYNKPSSMEAAWKYLIINSIGLLLGFFGTLLYFTSLHVVGGGGFTTWNVLLSNAPNLSPMVGQIAFIFVLIGYGTKVGLAPMHTWLPDAHSKAPVPISALLSGVLLNVAFVAVLRFKAITDLSVGSGFTQKLLIVFGLISIVVATFIIFTQKNYKRLLAYSSIENMGIISLGFGFGGIGIFAAVLHMIYHALAKSTLFLSAGNIFLKYSSTKIAKVRGVISTLPVTSILFLTSFFIITGAPPFGIFFTKMYILSAGIQKYPALTILVIFLIALLFVGFFKQVIAMMFGKPADEIKKGEGSIWLLIPPFILIAIVFYLSFSLPPFLHTLINNATLQY